MSTIEWRLVENRVWVLINVDTRVGKEQDVSWDAAYYLSNHAWYSTKHFFKRVYPSDFPAELISTQQKLKYIETLWRMGLS